MTPTTTITPPTICMGTDTQPACRHYDTWSGCNQESNLKLSLETGKMMPIYTAHYVRGDVTRCGPTAAWYEPKPKPEPGKDGMPF